MNNEPDYVAIGCSILWDWTEIGLAIVMFILLSPFLLVIACVYWPVRWLATWLGKRHVQKCLTAASARSDN
jgi:hypothetical protein